MVSIERTVPPVEKKIRDRRAMRGRTGAASASAAESAPETAHRDRRARCDMPSKSAPAGDEPYWGPITANYDWYARARHPRMRGETPRGSAPRVPVANRPMGRHLQTPTVLPAADTAPPTLPRPLRAGARETTR